MPCGSGLTRCLDWVCLDWVCLDWVCLDWAGRACLRRDCSVGRYELTGQSLRPASPLPAARCQALESGQFVTTVATHVTACDLAPWLPAVAESHATAILGDR